MRKAWSRSASSTTGTSAPQTTSTGQLTRGQAEADDLVAEAFTKVLARLLDGRGPETAVRVYLLTALRHTAFDNTRRNREVELWEDMNDATTMVTLQRFALRSRSWRPPRAFPVKFPQ